MSVMRVDLIRVGERDREEFGDLAELAASIESVGLLHPVVVTGDGTLVAGDRRLAAVRHLGWTEVPVTVVDLTTVADVLRAEADENTCRKPLTPYEAARARERRARVLAPKADENKGGRGKTSPKLGEVSRKARETAKAAAIGTGYSGSTLDKVDRIRDVAERGIIRNGKAETPAPPEVVDVAKRSLGAVKQTGAAVDRATRDLDAAVAAYVGEGPEGKQLRLRKAVTVACRDAANLPLLSAERVAAICDEELWESIDRAARRLTAWAEEVDRKRPRGLHVVGGDQQ